MFFSKPRIPSFFLRQKLPFFFSTSSQNQFHLKFDLFYDENTPKRFYFPHKSSLFSVENLLKTGDTSIKTVDFTINDTTAVDKSLLFIDTVLKNNLKLKVNSQPFAYKIDGFQDLGYYMNSKYDHAFKENEVPFPQANLLSSLFQAYETKFSKELSENQTITAKHFQENLVQLIQSFDEINEIKIKQIESSLESSYRDLQKETKQFEALEAQLSKEAQNTLKFWLALTTIQFFVLFYICYYVYGWDFTEPIGYLISLGIETAAIGYFIKFRGDLGQNALFASKLSKLRPLALSKKTTNPKIAKELLNEKISIFKRMLLFTKT